MTSPAAGPADLVDMSGVGPEANARRGKFALLVMGVLSVVINGASRFPATQIWSSVAFVVSVNLSLGVAFAVYHRDRVMLRWFAVALVAGFAELLADWYGVTHAGPLVNGVRSGSLVYGPEPRLWVSPAYRPLAWTGTLIQFMALSTWLRDQWSTTATTVAVVLFGAAYMPLNEHLGRAANWWVYVRTPMLLDNAPYYIAVGEGLLCIPVVFAGRAVARAGPARLLAWGLLLGAGIFAAYWLGFALTGGCDASYPWPSGSFRFFAEHFDLAHGCSVPASVW
ncbi:MAG TPA: hypothetical protein VFU23_03160 [Gemmatimonadales bacterium]|nr:hypothetical protein [Gemmatimonadales bacterium]